MKNFILRQIEAGKKIKGVVGFICVKPTAECGSGSEGMAYVAVEITKLSSKNCGEIQICVKLVHDHYICEDDPKEWKISPSGFYQSIDEIKEVMKHRENIATYNQVVNDIGSYHSNRLVSRRRDSLIDLYNRSTDEAKAIIDKELAEKNTTLKKIGAEYFNEFAKILAKPLYIPNVKPDDIDEDEEWEDE